MTLSTRWNRSRMYFRSNSKLIERLLYENQNRFKCQQSFYGEEFWFMTKPWTHQMESADLLRPCCKSQNVFLPLSCESVIIRMWIENEARRRHLSDSNFIPIKLVWIHIFCLTPNVDFYLECHTVCVKPRKSGTSIQLLQFLLLSVDAITGR